MSIGGLTRPQAQRLLDAAANQTRVSFTTDAAHYDLAPAQVGANFNDEATLEQAYSIGHQPGLSFVPASLWQTMSHPTPLQMMYDFQPAKLAAFAQQVETASGKQPVDASISIVDGVPVAQPAQSGTVVAPAAVTQLVRTQLSQPGTAPTTLDPTIQPARIQVANLTSALAQTKQILATPIAITYQGRSFQPTPAQIGAWLVYDKSPPDKTPGLTPKLDPGAIAAYLDTVAKQVNVTPVTEKVIVQNGVATVYQQGRDGLALDIATLTTKLAALVPGQPLTLEAPTAPVPFPTQYNNSIALPYDRYIEVNLSMQHLWVYQDHKVVFDSPVTSGATGAGFPTATGMFSILAKETNRHLVGYQYGPAYNYDVFVQYWMPFYQGFGLHDASWRSSFGGSDYYYGGSHGCVNLPLATAAWLFNWSTIGTPVWVHT